MSDARWPPTLRAFANRSGTTLDLLTTPVIAGLLFTGTLAIVALMAWKGGNERRDVTFLASAAGLGGVCTALATLV